MRAIEVLTREHGLILQALESFSLAQEKIERGQQPSKVFFEKALGFFHDFADRFHHFKEEYLVFGLLAEKTEGAFDGPIAALRYQHERCRKFVDGIAESLDGYAEGDEIATLRLLENLAAYSSLLKRHIYEEDHIFFQLAEKELSEVEDKELLIQFETEEKRIQDQDILESNRKLVLEMRTAIDD